MDIKKLIRQKLDESTQNDLAQKLGLTHSSHEVFKNAAGKSFKWTGVKFEPISDEPEKPKKVKKVETIDVPYNVYATKDFLKMVEEISESGSMNMYVDEQINKKVFSDVLEKEIKLAIKKHGKYRDQGGSPLHGTVVLAMWNLLGELRKSTLKK